MQATGDAPIMKQKNYKVDAEKRIDWIITFIRKYLKLEETENLVSLKMSFIGLTPVHPKLVFVWYKMYRTFWV